MGKKEFAAAALDSEHKTYIVHVRLVNSDLSPSFSLLKLNVHTSRRPQVPGMIAKEAPTRIPDKYIDFANMFSPDLASKLPEHNGINDYAIALVNANGFIRLSKSPISAPISFIRKKDGSF